MDAPPGHTLPPSTLAEVRERITRATDDLCPKPELLSIADLDDLIESVAPPGPRYVLLPPWHPSRLLDSGASPFGRKRRARRARGRVRQLRAAWTPAHWDLFELFR
jgi:hypothetical protein